jgi:Tol biopolymer transport system component
LVLLAVALCAGSIGCGSRSTPIGDPTAAINTIAFRSQRALDGSDALGPHGTENIWVMNGDGSNPRALTRITAADANSFQPAWSRSGSKIVFTANRALDGSDTPNSNNVANIWLMSADGSGATPLTKLTAIKADSFVPSFSADGSKIVFASTRALDGSDAPNSNNVANIWVVKADGSGATPLTRLTALSADSASPSFSPDGSKIVFTSQRGLDGSDVANTNFTPNIWVVNADGSGATPLTRLTAINAESDSPSFSPDGSKIAFSSRRALDGSNAAGIHFTKNIWTIDSIGLAAPVTRLTDGGADSANPVWSPDGGTISFESRRALDGGDAANTNDTRNIWTIHADGSSLTPLTKLAQADSLSAKWSPDGSKLIFASIRALDGSDAMNGLFIPNIWVVQADGSGATPLTKLAKAGNVEPDIP